MKQASDNRRQFLRETGELSIIGLTLVFAIMIGYFLGSGLEQYWPHIKPWGVLTGVFLGITAGFMEMFRTIRRISRRVDNHDTESM
ncbi:MAG: AtpZ/AtpI family protein [Gemmatimonadota bacterium]|nr:AtpZ/AtpI family protein [Gemmatimonadota bacterium]